jgi:hypothetical protein
MDELELIRSFRRKSATPNPAARAAARDRLIAHIAADRPGDERQPDRARGQYRRADADCSSWLGGSDETQSVKRGTWTTTVYADLSQNDAGSTSSFVLTPLLKDRDACERAARQRLPHRHRVALVFVAFEFRQAQVVDCTNLTGLDERALRHNEPSALAALRALRDDRADVVLMRGEYTHHVGAVFTDAIGSKIAIIDEAPHVLVDGQRRGALLDRRGALHGPTRSGFRRLALLFASIGCRTERVSTGSPLPEGTANKPEGVGGEAGFYPAVTQAEIDLWLDESAPQPSIPSSWTTLWRTRPMTLIHCVEGAPATPRKVPQAMLVKDILQHLDLGSSVAEHDEALEDYFIETGTFRALVEDRRDTIAGDKGTGKTAIYRILQKRYPSLLTDVEVLAGFNPAGAPVFQRLTEGAPFEEGQYITIWKAYVLSLVGNWVLAVNEGAFSHKMIELDRLLKRTGLSSADDSANTIFSQIVNLVRRLTNPRSASIQVAITAEGLPVIAPQIEFGDVQEAPLIRHDEALRLLNDVLEELGFSVWVVLDRLDEAFQGFPESEVPALRALLRSYLDLSEFDRLTLKLFVRKDLFRRIIEGGFVNLTHINARKVEIVWDEEDLFDLLCRRLRENTKFIAELGLTSAVTNDELFYTLFPRQVDPGSRRPTTWNWILARIGDGNGIRPPRNLIDLVVKAQEAQQRREQRAARTFDSRDNDGGLIQSDAIKRGLEALSTERVEDTLLAEAGEHATLIERFRDGRAEHNDDSLAVALGVENENVRQAIKPLLEIGFLEQTGETFKVPMLYRGGLSITQGKAFDPDADPTDEDLSDSEPVDIEK